MTQFRNCFSCLDKKITCHFSHSQTQFIPDYDGKGYHAWCLGCGSIIHNPSSGEMCNK